MKVKISRGEFDLELLRGFLIKAKKEGYAGGDKPKTSRLDNNTKYYVWGGDSFIYYDEYQESDDKLRFFGTETVSFEFKTDRGALSSIPVWFMHYHGGLIVPSGGFGKGDIKKINSFLREQLLDIPENFPIRGPVYPDLPGIDKGRYLYSNQPKDCRYNLEKLTIREFSGKEQIFDKKRENYVFKLEYSGGLV